MQVSRLELRHPTGVTPVWVGDGALGAAAEELAAVLGGRRVFVISSPPVLHLHRGVVERLRGTVGSLSVVEVPDGEAAKGVECAISVWRHMLRDGVRRDSCVATLGGGAVGDLGGFVAGTLMRGLDLVQLPSTLLAQVDAAIGGKTAINLPEAKNSVGVFHHPVVTVADTGLLATLPERHVRSGLFEIVKIAAVRDPELFAVLEEELAGFLKGDRSALGRMVEGAIGAKIRVVEEDPRELDLRRVLNFGHTLGHALEATLGPEVLSHGEAVGYGMLFVLGEAVARGLPEVEAKRISELIELIGLPAIDSPLQLDEVMARVFRDKKARRESLEWVLPLAVGSAASIDLGERETLRTRVGEFLATIGAGEAPAQ